MLRYPLTPAPAGIAVALCSERRRPGASNYSRGRELADSGTYFASLNFGSLKCARKCTKDLSSNPFAISEVMHASG